MASKLTVCKLALIVASTAMAGTIHSGAQAAKEIDCNSGLTQIAIASQQGGEGGIWPSYAHCVDSAQQSTAEFVGTGERGTRSQREAAAEHAWPNQHMRD